MKWIRKVSPKLLLTCAAAVVLVTATVGSTLAYFTAKTQQETNQFTPGIVDITIDEQNGDTYILSSSKTVDNKVIQVENVQRDHAAAAYVRVRLVPVMRWDDDTGTGDPVTLSFSADSQYWVNGGDGFYYYKQILQPGEKTQPLVSGSISVPGGIPDGKKLEIQVLADSIQTVANAEQSAWGRAFASGAWNKLP